MRCGAKRELSIAMRSGNMVDVQVGGGQCDLLGEFVTGSERGRKDFACGFACYRGWGKDWDEHLDERDAAW